MKDKIVRALSYIQITDLSVLVRPLFQRQICIVNRCPLHMTSE